MGATVAALTLRIGAGSTPMWLRREHGWTFGL
jgi:hypothetical protein